MMDRLFFVLSRSTAIGDPTPRMETTPRRRPRPSCGIRLPHRRPPRASQRASQRLRSIRGIWRNPEVVGRSRLRDRIG